MDAEFPDFTGQSVVFYASKAEAPDWMDEGATLESPSMQKQGGRWFVVGRTIKSGNGESSWYNDRIAAVAWESVLYYLVIPTEENEAYWNERSTDDENKTPVQEKSACEPPTQNRPLLKLSLVLIGLVIPAAILVAVIVWIFKIISS